jgi:hypothetical protein
MGIITPSRQRRYTAALTILLAEYTFNLLSHKDKERLDEQGYASLDGPLIGFSRIEFQRMWPPALKTAWRVVAMADLGIPPAIEGEQWHIPKARRWFWMPNRAPVKLFSQYTPAGKATAPARAYLEGKGVNVQALDC